MGIYGLCFEFVVGVGLDLVGWGKMKSRDRERERGRGFDVSLTSVGEGGSVFGSVRFNGSPGVYRFATRVDVENRWGREVDVEVEVEVGVSHLAERYFLKSGNRI